MIVTRGAVVREEPAAGSRSRIEIADIELDGPRQNELLVRMVASGMCHSDDHMVAGGLPSMVYPICLGHEGAGVVQEIGPNTAGFEVGDHVVFSFVPACGRCRWCAMGRQNLCDRGALTLSGARPDDSDSFRMHDLRTGEPIGQMGGISTFAQHTTTHVDSAIKVDKDLPLASLCLLGCAVGTGWGSAVYAAGVSPGDVVIVMGVGGIGINAVQGAAFAGASHVIAVDPVEMKRKLALSVGATSACADIEEAAEVARGLTDGQGADSTVVTVGLLQGSHTASAFAATRKGGTIVLTAVAHHADVGLPVPLAELTLSEKRIQGALYGSSNPTFDIPLQTRLYRNGQLKLDELVSARYGLDQLEQGYADLRRGELLRGVVVF